jgi:hypothetical protein
MLDETKCRKDKHAKRGKYFLLDENPCCRPFSIERLSTITNERLLMFTYSGGLNG